MEHITVSQIKSRLDAGERLNIIDVREADEYAKDNIHALLLPLSRLVNFECEEIEGLKDEELIVHCQSGKRSLQACMILEQMGFNKTSNLTGGILAWREQLKDFNL